MKKYAPFRVSIHLLFVCMLFLIPFSSSAQTFNFKQRESSRKHSADDIKQHNGFNDTLIVAHDRWDEMVASGSSWASYLKFKNVQSYVSFSVNHRYAHKIFEPYTLQLTFLVYGCSNPAQPNTWSSPIKDTLTISYKPDSLAAFQDRQMKKYNGFHKIMVVLTGLYKINGAGAAPVAQNLSLYGSFNLTNFDVEASVIVIPYDKKVPYMGGYKEAYGDNGQLAITNLGQQQDYLPVLWKLNGMSLDNTTLKLSPVKYELEWTYVDNYKKDPETGTVSEKPASSLNYSFTDNATRIWLDTNYYRIPLSYQKGHLIYRVRLVRPDSDGYRYPIYGPWTLGPTGVVSSVPAASTFKSDVPHQSDSLNWQYTVSFAEQGKYKQVMSYYDGMLKNRQSITRFNSRPNQLVATEQIYDFEGRPSISILPTPINTGSFRFQQNLALNQNTGKPYKPADFDGAQLAACPGDVLVPPLSDPSLADIYYSPNNPDQSGFQKFVPDAGGYPFVQTIYSPGYDERVEKQGGAGDTLQIGHGHTVKNDYASTEQTDLNRLFGTNIGWAGYYRKTVSRDPNGQLSINVTDYRGKTMLSSMVGLPDTMKHALVSNENLAGVTQFTEDFLAGTTQQNIGTHRILDKIFFNEAAGNNTAQYKLTMQPFQTFCPGKYLTVPAKYDYTIFDECGTVRAHDAGQLGSLGVTNSGTALSLPGNTVPFYMEIGKHSLHKDLSFRTSDAMAAVDKFMSLSAAENCLRTEPNFIKESVLSKEYPCPQDLSNYECPSCGSKEYEMIQELWPNQDSANLRRKYGVYKVINGAVVGNNNSDFTIFCGNGTDPNQWTTVFDAERVTSLLGGGEGTPYPGGFNIYTWPVTVSGGSAGVMPPGNPYLVLNGTDTLRCRYRYQDPCVVTMPASVTKYGQTYTGLQQLPVTDFINIFNDDIAKALLPLHPEYCELLACVDDTYKKLIGTIHSGSLAAQLRVLRLRDIIEADPVYAVMQAHPAQFPHPFDSLAYSKGHYICLDTIAFNEAYCRSSDGNMLQECQASIFGGVIRNGMLINEYVQNRYFESIKNVYFANRKRFLYLLSDAYANGVSCNVCKPVRMRLVPDPVFPKTDSIYASLLSNFNGAMSTASPAGTTSGQAALNQYFQLSNGVNLDTLQGFADSAINTYIATGNILIQATIDSMMAQFANCTPAGNLPAVRAYLQHLYNTGAVSYLRFTPAQVRAALKAGNIILDDLCNPYIVNYDNFSDYSQDFGSGMQCGDLAYISALSDFLNSGGALNALQHPGTYYQGFSPSSNLFAESISLGYPNSIIYNIKAAYNATDHLYTLTYYTDLPYAPYVPFPLGLQQVARIFIKADIAANACQFPFAAAPGESLSLKAYCTKDAFGAFPAGLIGTHTFALGVKHSSSGNTYECKLKAWSDEAEFNNTSSNPISNSVSMPQMKRLYEQFADTLKVYQVKGANHPYYSTMLRNFMNDRLGRSYTDGQYQDFIESCALTDSMEIPDYLSYYAMIFADNTAMINFQQALNNVQPNVVVSHAAYNVSYGACTLFNLTDVPKNKLRLYDNFIRNYPCVTGYYNWDKTVGWEGRLFTPDTYNLAPGASTLNLLYSGICAVWNGTSFVPSHQDVIQTSYPYDHSYNARAFKTLKDDVIQSGGELTLIQGIESYINDDYYKPAKQAYLRYAYGMQNWTADAILQSLQPNFLTTVPGALYGKMISYGHPARPDNIQNLYIGDPATMTNGTKYAKMQEVITQVTNYFNGVNGNTNNNILFTGANTRQIPQSAGKLLTAYRCQDTAFWFRYFDQGDTLYNMFVGIPRYIDSSWYRTYRLSDYGPNLGEGNSRSFWMQFTSNSIWPAFRVNGFTDFTVAKNEVLRDVLLAHSVMEDMPDIDTLNNCERQKLNAAIYEGKVRYRNYIDSVRSKLYNDFYAHLRGDALQEQLNVSYRNQRFNYTLYNYDRAGNMVRTVPPAGVNPLTNTDGVDVSRSNNPSGNLAPLHNKPSDYEYNTLNQVVYQHTPDGGATDFFYDAAGRVLFSQNDKQRPLGNMTYTLYDNQGRIVETGESKLACPYFTPGSDVMSCSNYDPVRHEYTPYPELIFDLAHKTNDQVVAFVRSFDRHEVVLTVYDTACLNVANRPGYAPQENLRKRVATIKYFDVIPPNEANYVNYKYATHFSYDITGNVKTLTRDYPSYRIMSQDLKRIDYDYDVISGKVNMLSYNRGFADQYFQRYGYDDDNRITDVSTSSDGVIWERDASYQYYQHGPLARTEMGELNVQGVDYAYTIQGWLKAVNGDLLAQDKEMGQDGFAGMPHSAFTQDAAAISLDYFKGDYKPIGNTQLQYTDRSGKNLYNGNIPRATTAVLPFQDLSSRYTYDQLNRIVRSDYANLNRATAQLTNTADYYSSYAYDPDGNLKKLVRKGNNPASPVMDSMLYHYSGYLNYSTGNNRLLNVTDYANDVYNNDIKKFTAVAANRYSYDETGNVTQDLVSGQDNISWNHYNKVTDAYKGVQNQYMRFEYDGSGQRYLKGLGLGVNSEQAGAATGDYYVRDAQGNILAVYKDEAEYKMDRRQWTEYITAQVMRRCDPWVFTSRVLRSYYFERSFKNSMFTAFNQHEDFMQQISALPVSYFLQSQPVSTAFLGANYQDPSMFAALAADGASSGSNILGDALNKLTADDASRIRLLETLYNVSAAPVAADMSNTYLGILCAKAPDVLQTAMADYGVTAPFSSDCNVNALNFLQVLQDKGFELQSLVEGIRAAGDRYPGSYQKFLEAVYAEDRVFSNPATGRSGSYLNLLCEDMPEVLAATFKNMGIGVSHDCDKDIQTLRDYISYKPKELTRFNALLNSNALADPKTYNHFGEIILQPAAASARIDWNIWAYLEKYMQKTNIALAYNMGMDPAEKPDQAATFLTQYQQQHPDPATAHKMMSYVVNNLRSMDGDDAFSSFVNTLCREDASLAMLTQANKGVNGLIPILNSAMENPLQWESFGPFIDKWDGARAQLNQVCSREQQLEIAYRIDPAATINNYINLTGDKGAVSQSLGTISWLTPDRFLVDLANQPRYCLETDTLNTIVHDTYEQVLARRRFYLAEHDLYGSSRLGVKTYLPGQFYKYYDYTGPTPIIDTATMAARPWYSLEHNSLVAGLALEPYGNADPSNYYLMHTIGLKQYEISNHLSNVQATITDLPYPALIDDWVAGYKPALAAAYDYYPFGMLMPGRFVSDESQKCMTQTQTKWVTNWVDSCYDTYTYTTMPNLRYTNGATLTTSSKELVWDVSRVSSSISFDQKVVPNLTHTLSLNVVDVSGGSGLVSVVEWIGGKEFIRATQAVTKPAYQTISFNPVTDWVEVRVSGPTRIKTGTVCVKRPVQTQQTMLVDICSGDKDRYRFGFNGQEKVNEWSGVGNFNEFSERGQDTRTGRFLSVDPIAKQYPWNSAYAFAENSVIQGIDLEGLELLPVNTSWYRMQVDRGKTKVITLNKNNIPSVFKDAGGMPLFTPMSVHMLPNGLYRGKNQQLWPANNLPRNPEWQYADVDPLPANGEAGGTIGTNVDANRAFADQAVAVGSASNEIRATGKTIMAMPIWNAYGDLWLNSEKFDRAIQVTKNALQFSDGFDPQLTADVTNFITDGSLPAFDFKNRKSSLEREKNIMDAGMSIMNKCRINIQKETKTRYDNISKQLNKIKASENTHWRGCSVGHPRLLNQPMFYWREATQ